MVYGKGRFDLPETYFLSLMKTHGESLDEELLNALFVEVGGIVNSRLLMVETINDVNSEAALSL